MRSAGGILALDLGTCSGYAYAFPGGDPVYGSVRLPADRGDGAFFNRFRQWLLDQITVMQPRLLVYEAPLITGGKTSLQTVFRLFGLATHTVEIAYARELKIEPANNATVKKHVAGFGHAKKFEVADVIRSYGWEPDNDNVSDALAILLWAESKFAPKVRRSPGPLFAQAGAA